MPKSIDEKMLLYRIRTDRDPDAFTALYDLHVAAIYRFVFFKIGNREEAEDVVSDVFLKAWQYLTAGEDDVRNVKPFLYSIARHAVIDIYRSRAKVRELPLTESLPIADTHDVAESFDQKQAVDKILNDIKKLKQEYQEVLFLRYVEELSLIEIAKVLGKGATNVRVLLHRAVKKLKDVAS